jgi:glycosyltransferase involved in cell wall biosynthesis
MIVTHLTTVHKRFDTRIFLKQCRSISENGYEVILIVADGQGSQIVDGIKIIDVGKFQSRALRVLFSPFQVLYVIMKNKSHLYHFHDPELIPIAIFLRVIGRKVIFDAHEDIPHQIFSKPYLPRMLKPWISKIYNILDKSISKIWSGVIGATPFITDKYSSFGANAIAVNNFPILDEFSRDNLKREKKVCYIGAFSLVRGIKQMVLAMEHVENNTALILGGEFADKKFKNEVTKLDSWLRVDHKGWLSREEIEENLKSSLAGLVVLHPTKSYLESLPVKMFEYMSAGVAVIASDFPFWNSIIKSEKCGLCVDPMCPISIAEAINFITANPEKATEMGKNGREAIINKYNWDNEKKVLLSFYASILGIQK